MKQLFHIENGRAEHIQQVLSLRIGEKHISFAITDKTGNAFYELVYCSFEKWKENLLIDFIDKYPSIHHSFYEVLFSCDFPQSILTPLSVYQMGESQLLLQSMYGLNPGSHIISDLIPDWQLYNTYSVPDEIIRCVKDKFPDAKTMHQFTLALKKIQAGGPEGVISVDFRKEDFTMLVAGNSKMMLAQTFPYETPGDVIYYLLKTCNQFSFSQKKVNVQLTGLVEKESPLFKELYQYFINLEFRGAEWKSANELPVHFFTSLNDLALCAS